MTYNPWLMANNHNLWLITLNPWHMTIFPLPKPLPGDSNPDLLLPGRGEYWTVADPDRPQMAPMGPKWLQKTVSKITPKSTRKMDGQRVPNGAQNGSKIDITVIKNVFENRSRKKSPKGSDWVPQNLVSPVTVARIKVSPKPLRGSKWLLNEL